MLPIKLSIILPVYNVEQYISDCILSIFSIKDVRYELIIVDDGSEDKSIEIAERLCHGLNNVTVIHQKNMGLSAARNSGMKIAKGEYIWFVDSDDKIIGRNIGALLGLCNDEDIIVGNFINLVEDSEIANVNRIGQTVRLSGIDALNRYYLRDLYTVVWRYIYKRDYLVEHSFSFYEGITFEDVEWSPRVISQAKTILISGIQIYIYRKRAASIVNSAFSAKKVADIVSAADSLFLFVNNHAMSPTSQAVFGDSAAYFILMALAKIRLYHINFDSEILIRKFLSIDKLTYKYSIIKAIYYISPKIFYTIIKYKYR